jgi:hypothetical protein
MSDGDSLTATGRERFLLWVTLPHRVRVRLDDRLLELPRNEGEALIGHQIALGEGGPR